MAADCNIMIYVPGYFSCMSCYSCDSRTEGGLCRKSESRRHISWEESRVDDKISRCNVFQDLVTPFYHRFTVNDERMFLYG